MYASISIKIDASLGLIKGMVISMRCRYVHVLVGV
jgi:hypothetical protein